MQTRNALIAGATGLVGNSLLQQLLANDQYVKILVLSRRPITISHPKLFQQQIDFDKINMLKAEFPIDDVFCALGTTIKTAGSKDAFYKVDYTYVLELGRWCSANNIKRIFIVSAMGANAKSSIFYNRVKGEMEAAVSKISIPEIKIFRPSLLLGNRSEKRGGEKLAQLVMSLLGFMFKGSLLKYKGIHADVVAKSMINAALKDEKGIAVYESGEMQGMGQ